MSNVVAFRPVACPVRAAIALRDAALADPDNQQRWDELLDHALSVSSPDADQIRDWPKFMKCTDDETLCVIDPVVGISRILAQVMANLNPSIVKSLTERDALFNHWLRNKPLPFTIEEGASDGAKNFVFTTSDPESMRAMTTFNKIKNRDRTGE